MESRISEYRIMVDRAKELFFNYLGSKYQMMRDEVVSEYLSYKIPQTVEETWIENLFATFYNNLKFNINDHDSLFKLFYLIECHELTDKLNLVYELISHNISNIDNIDNMLSILHRVIIMLENLNSDATQKLSEKYKNIILRLENEN